MKYGFFAAPAIFLAGSISAFAQPTSCSENADLGYSARFSADMSSVEIISTTTGNSTVVANLDCSASSAAPPSKPGRVFVLATCHEPHMVDAGYSLVVRQNSRNGSTTATLSEVTFAGANPIAEMSCQ